ncbi:MAG: DUF192 domain-containing protein [Sulfitobacter sp.]|nr:DUF192 domain-containing protein [Sulfitobacter sp.]
MGNSAQRRIFRTGLKAGLLLLGLCAALPALADVVCREDTIHLRGDWGTARFSVEIADDPAEQARGLMFREEMSAGAGMLFVYDRPQRASFWMRNTLIPLDMIFVDETGVVQRIHQNAIPLDETPINGGEAVLAVLEINGGMAARLGIAVGSEMRHPAFDPEAAAWPC